MDVVFGHQGIGSCQIEEIVVPGLCAFQLVFRVLCLSLGRKMKRVPSMQDVKWIPNVLKACIAIISLI